ncbi:sodium-coupled monocarboxylate transporter 1-like [Haliotis cracherodii]|uniref:sodium-coupled monocarboxylate transporter 1-like n=1 Tax=Haliotis cracherodii TaxID=6455 RepID=UPI0039ECFF69
MSVSTFGPWDYAVFALMLTASIGIGVYYAVASRKRRSTSEYFVAGQSMSYIPVALSLIATFESSVMILGTPAESYAYGIQWILGELGSLTAMLIDISLVLVFIRRLKLSTPYEYLEKRFQSRPLRVLANVMSCLLYLQYTSIVLYGQAIALQAVTGFSMYSSIMVTAGAVVFYTTLGGFKAVIWTDVLQCIIMLIGLFAVSIKGTIEAGGILEVWGRAAESGRLDFSLDPDPTIRHTVWNLYFGQLLGGFGFLFNPAVLQRISSTKSTKDSSRALLLTIPGYMLTGVICVVEGIVAYGYYYHKRCDPVASKQLESPNQIVPLLILDLFRSMPGMSGLFLAALSSAALSTISSFLSAVANIIWYDLVQPCRPNMSEFRGVIVAKMTVVFTGGLSCLAAIIVSFVGAKTLIQIAKTSLALTKQPLIGVFYLGALFPFVNTKGAIIGLLTGVVFMAWLTIGSMFYDSGAPSSYLPLAPVDQCPSFNLSIPSLNITNINNFTTTLGPDCSYEGANNKSAMETMYNISYTLFSAIAMIVVMLVGVCASLITGGNKTPVDPQWLLHLEDIQLPCIPNRVRQYFWPSRKSGQAYNGALTKESPEFQELRVEATELIRVEL